MSVGVRDAVGESNLVGGGEGIREGELVESSDLYFLVYKIISKFLLLYFDVLDMILGPVDEVSIF